jgi:hypothetical protein
MVMLLAGLVLAGCSGKEDLGRAQAAVAAFHANYNRADYAAISADAVPGMQTAVARQQIARLIRASRDRLGQYVGGRASNMRVNYRPSGAMVSVDFKSRYSKGGEAFERFAFAKDGDRMLMTGYQINSEAFFPQ